MEKYLSRTRKVTKPDLFGGVWWKKSQWRSLHPQKKTLQIVHFRMVEIDRVIERLSVARKDANVSVCLSRRVEDNRLEERTIDLVRAGAREEQPTRGESLEGGAAGVCVRAFRLIQ